MRSRIPRDVSLQLAAFIALTVSIFAGCGSDDAPPWVPRGLPSGATVDAGPPANIRVDGGTASQTNGGVCRIGETRSCYSGLPETRNVGMCHAGIETCVREGEFGRWGACVGSLGPNETGSGGCECTPATAALGGPDKSARLCDGVHSECDCGKAGGKIVDIGEACRICRFDAPACPSGWDGYKEWRTTADGQGCGGVLQVASTGPGGALDNCPPFVPAVSASSGTYLLSCDRETSYCCGSPPSAVAVPRGHVWSPHAVETTAFTQGYNACGCACGPEHCTTIVATCSASVVQIGCR